MKLGPWIQLHVDNYCQQHSVQECTFGDIIDLLFIIDEQRANECQSIFDESDIFKLKNQENLIVNC